MFFKTVILFVVALILLLAVIAVPKGYQNMKASKVFTGNKKMNTAYWVASAIHMWTGIAIILCYLIIAGFILLGTVA